MSLADEFPLDPATLKKFADMQRQIDAIQVPSEDSVISAAETVIVTSVVWLAAQLQEPKVVATLAAATVNSPPDPSTN